jgi:hypothetical protein
MKKIGFYTRHKLQKYTFALANEVSKKNDAFIFSEDNLHDARILNTEIYFDYSGLVENFSDIEINDIIIRCRVLRSLNKDLAFKLIQRANLSVCGMFHYYSPTVIVSPRIDNYYLDILNRVCIRRDIKFIGLWRSAFIKGSFFLTSRGDFNKVRNPNINEVYELIQIINHDEFKGTSIGTIKFQKIRALFRFSKLFIRACVLEFIRRISSNKFRYRELATRFFVNEYKVRFRDIFFRYNGFNINVHDFFQKKRPIVFLALQVNPESTIDYYTQNLDFISIAEVLPQIVKIFISSGYDVVIKDHPNMIGNRTMSLFKDLFSFRDNLCIAPTETDSTFLIKKSDITFTWSGTVAIQAVMMKKKAICVCVPYYLNINSFYRINSTLDLINLLNTLDFHNDPIASNEQIFSLAEHILSSHLPGDIYSHNNKPLGNYTDVANFISNSN